jgi:3-phenylpropionate/trans-cinnamate dioxygenase ferredoxin subunit
MAKHVVAPAAEVKHGGVKIVTVGGREIGLFNLGGEYFALLNRCPHAGANLCSGQIIGLAQSDEPGTYRLDRPGEMVRCPWHGWEYDIRTGQSWCDPEKVRVPRFAVARETGQEIVKGPYIAETFPVAVEDDYLVVEIDR